MTVFHRGACLLILIVLPGQLAASSEEEDCLHNELHPVEFLQESAVVTARSAKAGQQSLRLPDVNVTEGPEPSAIWKSTRAWMTMKYQHPVGVVSTLPSTVNGWKDVSYFSVSVLLCLCSVAYPICGTGLLVLMTVLVSMCLVVDTNKRDELMVEKPPEISNRKHYRRPGPTGTANTSRAPGDVLRQFECLPLIPKSCLTPMSQTLYAAWAFFCCAVPCLMVFGNPILMVLLARPYPQEVAACLSLVTAGYMFGNSIYMLLFGSRGVIDISKADDVDYKQILPAGSEAVHWVILPQYKEDIEVTSVALRSVACSSIARSSIGIVLAMEEREEGAKDKAAILQKSFEGEFKEIIQTFHPPNLPNDPPGKASNIAYAFEELLRHIEPSEEEAANIVLTVADADSEFHSGYFESLTREFLGTDLDSRYWRLWQAPVLHMKNYHRQPSPVIVGTMFTCAQELSTLSDPNAFRLPYSSYSLSLKLARHVGGWDPQWIAEDYHMGIKCFLMSLGRTTVEPVMLPIVNYVPEEPTWVGTCLARWTQLKRHALGFSDLSYYFMMLPLIFSYSTSSSQQKTRSEGLMGCWKLLRCGVCLLMKLLNVHVLIGVLSTYGALVIGLEVIMLLFFQHDRTLNFFLKSLGLLPTLLAFASTAFTILTSLMFLQAYRILAASGRIEGTPEFEHPLLHWLKNLIGLAMWSPFYFVLLGYALWCAALGVLTKTSFEYEVAPKPVKQT